MKGMWSIIGSAAAIVVGVACQAIPGAGTAVGGLLIAAACLAITAPCAAKDAQCEKDIAKEKEEKECEAQQLQEADDRLKVTATSFGASTEAVLAARSASQPSRSSPGSAKLS